MNTLGDLPGRPAPKPTGSLTPVDLARTLLARARIRMPALKPILMRHHSAGDAALGEGATPILRAAKAGDVAMIRLLLDRGADPTLTTRSQTTAVMLAAGPAGGGLGGSFPVTGCGQDRGDRAAARSRRRHQRRGRHRSVGAARRCGPGGRAHRDGAGAARREARSQGQTGTDAAGRRDGHRWPGAPVPRTAIVELLRRFAGPAAAAPARMM